MKKTLPLVLLVVGLAATHPAQAQLSLIRLGVNSAVLAKRVADRNAAGSTPTPGTPATASYQGKEFPMLRTPANQLPKKGGEQVTAMETELERCHTALLADPSGIICTPEQRVAIQTAIVNLARVQSSRNLQPYQQEASFYLAEDVRRQQAAAAPAGPAR